MNHTNTWTQHFDNSLTNDPKSISAYDNTYVIGLGLLNDVTVLAEPDVNLIGHHEYERVATVDAGGARLDQSRLTVATTCTMRAQHVDVHVHECR